MTNIVYIATSLDGYIADKNNQLDWLHDIENPEKSDFGFSQFIQEIDALVMGRNTFETVLGFDCEWPYHKPVFVVSNSLQSLPDAMVGKAELIQGSPKDIVQQLNQRGYNKLYIDGGKTIQRFLNEDLIDEMIITTFPILLGGGASLFGNLENPIKFHLESSQILLNSLIKSHYKKKQ